MRTLLNYLVDSGFSSNYDPTDRCPGLEDSGEPLGEGTFRLTTKGRIVEQGEVTVNNADDST